MDVRSILSLLLPTEELRAGLSQRGGEVWLDRAELQSCWAEEKKKANPAERPERAEGARLGTAFEDERRTSVKGIPRSEAPCTWYNALSLPS